MTWYLRATERPDGTWECRFGGQEFGILPSLPLALDYLAEAASELGGRDIFVFYLHHLDGRIETRRATDPVPGEVDA